MWAIIKESSYSQDGGHGYGVYSTSYTEFIPFKTEKELLEWVDKNRGTKYNAMRFASTTLRLKRNCQSRLSP